MLQIVFEIKFTSVNDEKFKSSHNCPTTIKYSLKRIFIVQYYSNMKIIVKNIRKVINMFSVFSCSHFHNIVSQISNCSKLYIKNIYILRTIILTDFRMRNEFGIYVCKFMWTNEKQKAETESWPRVGIRSWCIKIFASLCYGSSVRITASAVGSRTREFTSCYRVRCSTVLRLPTVAVLFRN